MYLLRLAFLILRPDTLPRHASRAFVHILNCEFVLKGRPTCS